MRKKTEVSKPKVEKAKAAPKKTVKKPELKKEEKSVRFGIHNLIRPEGARKNKKMLGRGSGSGHGKTSTRGSKGQTSRSGRDFYLGFEGGQSPLIRKIAKRGFTSKFPRIFQIVNLESLVSIKNKDIDPQVLLDVGLIKSKNKPVKILGDGQLKQAFNIKAHAFSKTAQEKIKSAGGSFEVMND